MQIVNNKGYFILAWTRGPRYTLGRYSISRNNANIVIRNHNPLVLLPRSKETSEVYFISAGYSYLARLLATLRTTSNNTKNRGGRLATTPYAKGAASAFFK